MKCVFGCFLIIETLCCFDKPANNFRAISVHRLSVLVLNGNVRSANLGKNVSGICEGNLQLKLLPGALLVLCTVMTFKGIKNVM